jgi:RNA polymerase sigma-70 factor (ECF subfamily)
MGDSPLTRPSLLLRIRDGANHEAWRQFVGLYAPLVYQFGRKRGLQDADAADLTQLVFGEVARTINRLDYDPDRGSFHGWLLAVTRNQMYKLLSRRRKNQGHLGNDVLEDVAAKELDQAVWDQEYPRRLFRWATDQVRGEFEEGTWQAFWQTAVEGKSAKEVGDALQMSVGAVYTAKSRVTTRLRKVIQQVEHEEGLSFEV